MSLSPVCLYPGPHVGDPGPIRPDGDPAEETGREPSARPDLAPRAAMNRAAAIAATRPGPGVETVLVEALEDPEAVVRASAARTLAGTARGRGTRSLIRAASTDPAPEVRAEAVAALARILEARLGSEDAGGVDRSPA